MRWQGYFFKNILCLKITLCWKLIKWKDLRKWNFVGSHFDKLDRSFFLKKHLCWSLPLTKLWARVLFLWSNSSGCVWIFTFRKSIYNSVLIKGHSLITYVYAYASIWANPFFFVIHGYTKWFIFKKEKLSTKIRLIKNTGLEPYNTC